MIVNCLARVRIYHHNIPMLWHSKHTHTPHIKHTNTSRLRILQSVLRQIASWNHPRNGKWKRTQKNWTNKQKMIVIWFFFSKNSFWQKKKSRKIINKIQWEEPYFRIERRAPASAPNKHSSCSLNLIVEWFNCNKHTIVKMNEKYI